MRKEEELKGGSERIDDVDRLIEILKPAVNPFPREGKRKEWREVMEWVDFRYNPTESTVSFSIEKGDRLVEATLLSLNKKMRLRFSRGIKIEEEKIKEAFIGELPVEIVNCDSQKGELNFLGGSLSSPVYATFYRTGRIKIESD